MRHVALREALYTTVLNDRSVGSSKLLRLLSRWKDQPAVALVIADEQHLYEGSVLSNFSQSGITLVGISHAERKLVAEVWIKLEAKIFAIDRELIRLQGVCQCDNCLLFSYVKDKNTKHKIISLAWKCRVNATPWVQTSLLSPQSCETPSCCSPSC
jgi:hypothetical protein